eukprot:6463666-Lingulodinium_polyedra.AAC.1
MWVESSRDAMPSQTRAASSRVKSSQAHSKRESKPNQNTNLQSIQLELMRYDNFNSYHANQSRFE